MDYTSMLRLTGFMTRDVREILKAYERCVFNVIFHNRDDHAKNFSFRMNDRGHWRFSPAYGLTFSEGPGGEHQMDICGEGRTPAKADLLKLASQTNIKRVDAIAAIERISAVAADFTKTARRFPIRKATVEQIAKKIDTNRSRMA
ncbi:HipA domain-containing protein [Paraburkholderia gardini]|uniref:HipA domain-containing protein n=1 Tax=Paraburkholderia gardini TaxID=2823469 RepID=UPI0038992108